MIVVFGIAVVVDVAVAVAVVDNHCRAVVSYVVLTMVLFGTFLNSVHITVVR